MSAFINYQLAIARREAAYAEYNAAGLKLENAQIWERFAGLQSQHNPMAEIIANGEGTVADKMVQAARYVVKGRTED